HRVGRSLKLVDLGTLGGTLVNGDRVVEYGPLSERDQIVIAGYRLRVYGESLRLPPGSRPGAALVGSDPSLRPADPEAQALSETGSGVGAQASLAAAPGALQTGSVPERLAA